MRPIREAAAPLKRTEYRGVMTGLSALIAEDQQHSVAPLEGGRSSVRVARTLAIIATTLVAALTVTVALTARTFTPPIRGADGRIVEGSIAEERRVELGGWEHYVLVRGRSRTAPILIFVHGGPGATEMPLFRVFNAPLEND